jgi:non-ribosomal peptide synthetase component F
MNSLAFRGDLSGNPSFRELLRRIRKTALDAYAHQDLPFEKLVAEIQPRRSLGYSPVFQVMFILQNTPTPKAKAGLLKFVHQDIDAGNSKLDLTLNLEETSDGCIGWVEYSTDLFDRATIGSMVQEFQTLLKAVVLNPDGRLSGMPLESVPNDAILPKYTSRTPTKQHGQAQLAKTPTEKELVSIWSEVLGVEKISLSDNLFDLGGHSLLITRIMSRIRKSFQIDVPIHAFFETPTVADIAALIDAKKKTQKSNGSLLTQGIRKRNLQPA